MKKLCSLPCLFSDQRDLSAADSSFQEMLLVGKYSSCLPGCLFISLTFPFFNLAKHIPRSNFNCLLPLVMPLLTSFHMPHLERNENEDVLLLQCIEMNETESKRPILTSTKPQFF